MNRQQYIDDLVADSQIDVLIIGAGVNGIGVFRECAINGLRTLIVDKSDFVSGASAASSRMVHGGIRYLENGEFRLVREAVQERNRLLKSAPHLVKPLPTTFPIFKIFSGLLNAPLKFLGLLDKPAERGALVLKIGMVLYDAFARQGRGTPKHKFMGRSKSLSRHPKLNNKIIGAAIYYDAAMPSPERICFDMLTDSLSYKDTYAFNYFSTTGVEDTSIWLKDELTGNNYQVEPEIVINAAGPWVDQANQALGNATSFMRGTKGSHIILENKELFEQLSGHEIFFENEDGRIVLIYPLFDKVLIGTTDIMVDQLDQVVCTTEEVEYFIQMVKYIFPEVDISADDIIFKYSGVRPLPSSSANTTGQISRDHKIEVLPVTSTQAFPTFSLIGGKWTTFRAFSEQVSDNIFEYLGIDRKKSTRELPIGGGAGYPNSVEKLDEIALEMSKRYGGDINVVQALFTRYGTTAEDILKFASFSNFSPVESLPEYLESEIVYLIQQEGVVHLEDLILRRTTIALRGLLSEEVLEELSRITATALGWSEITRRAEVSRTREILSLRHGVEI